MDAVYSPKDAVRTPQETVYSPEETVRTPQDTVRNPEGAVRKPYEGAEPYIFISYARKDAERVYPLLDALCAAGYRIWYDEGTHFMADWADVIAEHLAGSAVLLAFHSAASAESVHCKAEIHYGRSKNRPILSAYLEDDVQLPPGLEMYLGLWQSVKLSQYPDAAAFAARMEQEEAFAPCRAPQWHKVGQIQWKLDASGVLTIARNEDMPYYYRTGSIPGYQSDPINGGSTAPWMPYWEKIVSVVIENNIDAIGKQAFSDCTSLTAVTIPDSVREIGDWAFGGCTSLTAVTIGNRVTEIGKGAFSDCDSLTAVTIPDSVTKIGDLAFGGCTSLNDISADPSNQYYMSENGILFDKSRTTLICYPTGKTADSYEIPDSVIKIGDLAFSGCTSLTAVTIPDSVTEIDLWAFSDCTSLKRVEIPAGADVHPEAFDEHTKFIRRKAPSGDAFMRENR